MKTRTIFISLLLVSLLIMSCYLLGNLGIKVISPSNVTISENRDVSGFKAIDFRTLGKVNILPGDVESLNVSLGPDNLVPEIITEVSNETLIIRTKENININPLSGENPLTFTIVVKELTGLDVSGLGDVQLETLSTPSFSIVMSGAGKILSNQHTTDSLNIDLSGLGGVDINGEAVQNNIDVSGAGSVDAPDLKIIGKPQRELQMYFLKSGLKEGRYSFNQFVQNLFNQYFSLNLLTSSQNGNN